MITTKTDVDRELTRMWDELRDAELAGLTCRVEVLTGAIDRLLEVRLGMA
jgi:hypothetical protein